MSRLSRVIQLDPYFDGERDGTTDATLPGRDEGKPATPPNKYGYQDAANFAVSTGPVTSVMRPGPAGLRGTVIPKATMGGIPMGTRPHVTRDLEVVIDPHITGQSSRVRLGDVSAASVQTGVNEASEITPEPYSIETQRLRGSAIMHSIAQHNQGAQTDQPLQEAPQNIPVQQAPPPQQHQPQVQEAPQPYVPPAPTRSGCAAACRRASPPATAGAADRASPKHGRRDAGRTAAATSPSVAPLRVYAAAPTYGAA